MKRWRPVGFETDRLRRGEVQRISPSDVLLHRPTTRLEMGKNDPRSPIRLATIAQVSQRPCRAAIRSCKVCFAGFKGVRLTVHPDCHGGVRVRKRVANQPKAR